MLHVFWKFWTHVKIRSIASESVFLLNKRRFLHPTILFNSHSSLASARSIEMIHSFIFFEHQDHCFVHNRWWLEYVACNIRRALTWPVFDFVQMLALIYSNCLKGETLYLHCCSGVLMTQTLKEFRKNNIWGFDPNLTLQSLSVSPAARVPLGWGGICPLPFCFSPSL